MKFKVGDIVKADKNAPHSITTNGWIGEVVRICGGGFLIVIGKEKKEYLVKDEYFTKISNSKKIIIEVHDNKTVAKLYDGIHEKPYRVGIAKCSPEDKFDFETGAKLAFSRLMGEDENKNKKTEDEIKVGDKVVINDDGGSYTTYNKWFSVNNIDIDIAARYTYGRHSNNEGQIGVVEAIAPHESKVYGLVYAIGIGEINPHIYLYDKYSIEKYKD